MVPISPLRNSWHSQSCPSDRLESRYHSASDGFFKRVVEEVKLLHCGGNVTRVVRNEAGSNVYTATRMEYAKNGRTVVGQVLR